MPPLLRHGLGELLLVQPGTAVFAPPSPETLRKRTGSFLSAPAPLHVEAVLIALRTYTATLEARARSVRAVVSSGPAVVASWWIADKLRERAEQRSAQRIGLTSDTMPMPRISLHVVLILIASRPVTRLLRRRAPDPLPWELQLATFVVRAFNGRPSWQRAYAAARASQDLSSASSSTSGVCAPDTP